MDILCNHCKKPSPLELVSGRAVLAFRATCPHCASDLHVCYNCKLYDAGSHHECRESSAEWVRAKDKSNKCEYFTARDASDSDTKDTKTAAKSALDDLFK